MSLEKCHSGATDLVVHRFGGYGFVAEHHSVVAVVAASRGAAIPQGDACGVGAVVEVEGAVLGANTLTLSSDALLAGTGSV